MTPRRLIALALPFAAAAALAGCGGGGGDAASSDQEPPADPGAGFVPQGVDPSASAAQAVALLGTPGAVDSDGLGRALPSNDTFGAPHDVFVPQVRSDGGGGSTNGAENAPAAGTPDAPVVSPPGSVTPGVPVGGSTLPGGAPVSPDGPPIPPDGVPVQNPKALEADFDISGEPVVAREGDAIPPDTQQFTVASVGSGSVVLQLNAGLLPDGTDKVTLKKGEAITLYNATARQNYKIRLADIRPAG